VARDEEGRPAGDLGLRSHAVSVEILDGVARTTVEETFENHTDRRLEGTFHFPLPPDASISRLALEVNGKMEEGTCLERERAREVFEGIVRRMQDPALLEWQPGGIFKCRIFPIEPRSTKRVLVAYTQALPFFRGRATYVYPLASEKTRTHPPGEVRIDLRARVSGRLERIASPSHRIDVQRRDAREARMSFRAESYRPENDFVVTLETSDDELRVVPHKEHGDDGYFALFLTPRGGGARIPRSYAIVLDVSASVSAPELEVARRLVRAFLERRIPGDRFEILAHHIDVQSSGEVDLRAANDFMDRLRPVGGSDVLRALQAARADEVIYIGEGTPTMGETDPARILEAVKGRRIRTVAVGSDANASLLERLGGHARINPNDDVPRRVAEIADTLGSPVLSGLRVEGGEAVYDVVGLRDLFYGERLALAGRYRGPAAKIVVTAGDFRREIEVALPAKEEANSYVRRLWAQRKAADLLARGGPREEVVALGVKHQIMTPYTSFLVLESEQMWKDHQLQRTVPKPDEVLGKKGEAGDQVDVLFEEAATLYRQGKLAETTAKLEEAFQMRPSSDRVYAFYRRMGPEFAGRLMNDSLRRNQDVGRRLFELSKPGEGLREPLPGIAAYRGASKEREAELRRMLETLQDIEGREPRARARTGPLPVIEPPTGEIGPGFTTNESARLEAYDLRAQTLHSLMKGESLGGVGFTVGEDGSLFYSPAAAGKSLELYDHRDLLLKLQDFSGPKAELVSPQGSGGAPLTGASFELESGAKAGRVGDLQSALDDASTRGTRLESDVEVFIRQQEVQLAQIQELTLKLDEHRSKLAKALSEKSLAVAEVEFARRQSERLAQELAQLEERHVDLVRNPRPLEEKLNHLNQLGVKTDLAPKKPIEGKTTAVATEIGLVVISQGRDAGVEAGDAFTVYRGGEFVAQVVVDRVDAKWSAGKVVLKKSDPRPGDDVSNHIYVGAGGGRGEAPSAEAVAEVAGSEIVVRGRGLSRGRLVAIWRDSKFVAVVQIVEATGRARVWRGMAVGRILPGDRAELVRDLPATLAGLPEGVRLDLASRVGLELVRMRMRIGE
jgi:hypothetical protein